MENSCQRRGTRQGAGGRPECVWWAAAALISLSIIQGGIDFPRLLLSAQVGQRIVFGIRTALFEHLSRLSFSYYDRARTGDLMSRVTADVDAFSQFFGRAAVIVVTNALAILGILLVLIIWDWRLGGLLLLGQRVGDLRDCALGEVGRREKHLGIDHGQPGFIDSGNLGGGLEYGPSPVAEINARCYPFDVWGFHRVLLSSVGTSGYAAIAATAHSSGITAEPWPTCSGKSWAAAPA